MAVSRREKEKQTRRRQDAAAWAKQEDKGFVSHSIKLPEGFEFFKLEPGNHLVDFMPSIAGTRNPSADEGFEVLNCEYHVHKIPSPQSNFGTPYCCSYLCFKKPCATCTLLKSPNMDKDLRKALQVTRRHLFLINDKPGETKNRPKIFDIYHFNRGAGFGEMLKDAIMDDPEAYANFWTLDSGLSVRLTVKEFPLPKGGKHNAVTRISFVKRDYDYPESILDKMPCLDDCLIETDDDEMQQLVSMPDGEEEEGGDANDEAPPVRRRPAPKEEEEPEDEENEKEETEEEETPKKSKYSKGDYVHYVNPETDETEECEVLKVNEDGTLRLENEDAGIYPKVKSSEVTPVPTKKSGDEEDEEEPAPKVKTSAKKKPDLEDEEAEDDFDEPAPRRRR